MSQEIETALIVASATAFGAVASQITTFAISVLDKKHQKKVLLREKYEKMMVHFSDSLFWLGDVNCCTSQEKLLAIYQSPHSRKALSLCLLYFRDLSEKANDYVQAQASYYESVITVFKEEPEIFGVRVTLSVIIALLNHK